MPDYGWAYINLDVLKTIAGPTGSITIKVDDTTLSGSQYLAFATASNKVGIGLNFPTTMPTHQLHVSASDGEEVAANFTGDILVSGSAFISGTLRVESLEANTVISSSNLIVNDSVIGLGFGDGTGQTGSVGDRGFIFGLAGNLNQAIIWDQTSGSFVMGKVGAQGPEKDAFDITTADLGELRLGQISSSVGVSSSLGEFQNLRIGGTTITSVVDVSGTPANNQVAIWTDGNTIEGDSKLTFDGTTLKILGPISGSGDLDIVGAAVIEGALSVSGSSTLGDSASDVTKIVGHLSSSADAKIAGTTTIAAALNVSGSSTLGGAATTVTKVVGHLSASADVKIAGTTTIAAALNVSGSSTLGDSSLDGSVTINDTGADKDFRVETADESHMLFIEGSSNRMSIGDNTGSPGATLEVKNHASAGAFGVPLVQLNSNDTDQQCLDINASNITANVVNVTANAVTTARVLAIGADGLTTGNALYVDDNSSNTGTRNTALIIQNHTGAIAATALAVQSDGGVTGVKIDKNYSETAEASVTGLLIDWDKTGATTSDNTMYGIQVDMDNTTATNGTNYMYGLHVTPTLTHAANAGTPILYGALINAQGGTNGTSLVQGARIEAGGGDINYGIQLDVEDGGVDLRIESSADNGDYFQIQTTTHGATTITTVDDNATAAHLTFTVDGDITLDPAGGDVFVDGNVSGSGTLIAAGDATLANNSFFADASTKRVGIGTITPNATLEISGSGVHTDGMPKPIFQILHAGAETGGVSDGQPLLFVTGAVPDGFEGRLGINTNNPQASLHVMGTGNTSLLATNEGKVAIGSNFTPSETLAVRTNNSQIATFQNNIRNADSSADGPFNILFVSGSSDGGGYFGSHHSGSNFHLSGTAHISSLTASQLSLASTLSGTVAGAGSYLGVDSAGRIVVSTLQHGGGGAVTSYTNSGDNRIITSVNSSTINSEANLTFDGSELKITGHLSASANASILGTATIEGGLNVSGSSTLGDSAADVTKVVGHLSASSDVKIAGTTTIAAALNVSGSSTLGGAVTDSTSVIGHLSASTDVKVAGTAIIAGALNVSGTTSFNNTLSVAQKIEHAGDSDTFIDFTTDDINFTVGNVNMIDLTEDTQNEITFNEAGVDVDFRVESNNNSHLLFTEGSSDRVGIRASVPQAVFHISGSGHYGVKEEDLFRIDADAGQGILFVSGSGEIGIGTTAPGSTLEISGSGLGMTNPVFTIYHPGAETGGVSDGKPLIIVTGSTPDGFEGRLGINTDDPKAALHVAGAGNTALLATNEGKVAVGGEFTGGATFSVRTGNSQIAAFQNGVLNADDGADGPFNILFVSGSDNGGGYFGSHHSGSHLHVSGTSMLSSVMVNYSASDTHPLVVTCKPHDYVFAFKSDQGAYSLVLESAAVAGAGRKITVKDVGNNAGSNNITITGSTKSDLIEYSTSTAITGNKRATTLVSDGVSRWWVISTHDG